MSVLLSPSETLEFKRPFTRHAKTFLSIANPNGEPVVFKVRTTAPQQYSVTPNTGRLEAGASIKVSVILKAQAEEPKLGVICQDKFLVQSHVASQNEHQWGDGESTDLHPQRLSVIQSDSYERRPLSVTPSSILEFPAKPLMPEISRKLTLMNPNHQPVAFRVTTTAPHIYSISQNVSRLEPGKSLVVLVNMSSKENDQVPTSCDDKILVQGVFLPPDMGSVAVESIQWDRIDADDDETRIHELRLRIALQLPPPPSKPLPELPGNTLRNRTLPFGRNSSSMSQIFRKTGPEEARTSDQSQSSTETVTDDAKRFGSLGARLRRPLSRMFLNEKPQREGIETGSLKRPLSRLFLDEKPRRDGIEASTIKRPLSRMFLTEKSGRDQADAGFMKRPLSRIFLNEKPRGNGVDT